MADIKRFNGEEEFEKLLKKFAFVPSNVEIIDKTGVSSGSVSEIMSGKRTPSKNFIEKFKKGFGITDDQPTPPKTEKPPSEENGIYLTLKEHNKYLLKEIEFLREMLLKK